MGTGRDLSPAKSIPKSLLMKVALCMCGDRLYVYLDVPPWDLLGGILGDPHPGKLCQL